LRKLSLLELSVKRYQKLWKTFIPSIHYIFIAYGFFESRERALRYLEKRFDENPLLAVEFVKSGYRQSWSVDSTARLWGVSFILEALRQAIPNLDVPALSIGTNQNYLPDTQDDYVRYFMALGSAYQSSHPSEPQVGIE
jgi:hypothetical protein